MKFIHILTLLFVPSLLVADEAARAAYRSPYKVEFTFKDEELTGDLTKGPQAAAKNEANVPFRDWYDARYQTRWRHWGPAAKHFDPPAGLATKSPEWSRQRFVGYSYQHHHVPDWAPPADWPRDPKQVTPVGKGLDCSNFTAFVYNLALGIKPTGDVQDQSEITSAPGPGANRTVPVKRIEIPASYADFEKTLLTGDRLFIKSRKGEVSHVVLWVGKIGRSRDGTPLILDSTGEGRTDEDGNKIPDGVQLRPFNRGSWYASSASHALRIIPDAK